MICNPPTSRSPAHLPGVSPLSNGLPDSQLYPTAGQNLSVEKRVLSTMSGVHILFPEG